jgi:predicted RNase H-like HicB family nuclease
MNSLWLRLRRLTQNRPPTPSDSGYVFRVEIDREEDGRFIAEFVDLPGVMTYGQSQDEAMSRAAALAFRVMADRLDRHELEFHRMPLNVTLVPIEYVAG